MIELQKTKNIPANWDEKHLNIDGVDNLLDDKYSYEEKKGSMHYTGCIGEDTEVSIFAHVKGRNQSHIRLSRHHRNIAAIQDHTNTKVLARDNKPCSNH